MKKGCVYINETSRLLVAVSSSLLLALEDPSGRAMRALFLLTICIAVFITGSKLERIVFQTTSKNDTKVYNFFPLRTDFLEFNVKATRDVHIVLTNTYDLTPPYYEIKIGGWENTKSIIRKDQMKPYKFEHNGAIITKGVFQTFWVALNDSSGSISVGKNYNNVFMHFQDPEYVKMSYFGITTAFGGSGEWNFDFDIFKCKTCST